MGSQYPQPHLLLPLLERAAVAQLDGLAVVDGVAHDDAAVVALLLSLAARPARRRRLPAPPPDADPPPATAAADAVVAVRPPPLGGRRRQPQLVAAVTAADEDGVDGLECEGEASLHRQEPQAEGDRGHRPERRRALPLLVLFSRTPNVKTGS